MIGSHRKPMAEWFAVNMPDIDFQDITYYSAPKSASDGPKDLSDVDPDTLPVTHGVRSVIDRHLTSISRPTRGI